MDVGDRGRQPPLQRRQRDIHDRAVDEGQAGAENGRGQDPRPCAVRALTSAGSEDDAFVAGILEQQLADLASRLTQSERPANGTEVPRLGRRNRPAVDDVFRAGDRCGLGRDEEGNEVRYFPWLRRAPDRDAAE